MIQTPTDRATAGSIPDPGGVPVPPNQSADPPLPRPASRGGHVAITIAAILWSVTCLAASSLGLVGYLAGAVAATLGALALFVWWLVHAWHWRARPSGRVYAFAMVPAVMLATYGFLVADFGGSRRQTAAWEISRGEFEATADRLALPPGESAYHPGGRFVGIVFVDSIEVDGPDVAFNLPGFLDHGIIVRDVDDSRPWGMAHDDSVFAGQHPLGPGWYRAWFHF